MELELIYSDESVITKILMVGEQYDINFVVEDTNKEYQYEEIFKRILGRECEYNIGVYALGGKSEVLKAYKIMGEVPKENHLIRLCYVLDGDFDRYISPENMIVDRCCIYLERYNIESYFIEENAAKQIIKGKLCCKDCDLQEKFDFNSWKDRIIKESSKLFFLYCCIQKNYSYIMSIARSPYCFIDGNTGFERPKAYSKLFNEIAEIDDNIENNLLKIREKYTQINGDNIINLICGKFLIVSLKAYIQDIVRKEGKTATFKGQEFEWGLINNFEAKNLKFIKDTVLEIVAN